MQNNVYENCVSQDFPACLKLSSPHSLQSSALHLRVTYNLITVLHSVSVSVGMEYTQRSGTKDYCFCHVGKLPSSGTFTNKPKGVLFCAGWIGID